MTDFRMGLALSMMITWGTWGIVAIGCNAQQVATLESGIGSDAALVGCILLSALDGASVPGIIASCGSDAVTVGTVLINAVDEADGGAVASLQADRIGKTSRV